MRLQSLLLMNTSVCMHCVVVTRSKGDSKHVCTTSSLEVQFRMNVTSRQHGYTGYLTCTHPPACSLDTGRLNAETYQLFDAVEKHYGIRIEYTFPDAQECVDLVRAKGMFSFYEDGHQECCRVRKVSSFCSCIFAGMYACMAT